MKKTYEEMYGIEKAAELREKRRQSGKKHWEHLFGENRKRQRNIEKICRHCANNFMAADPKNSRCEKCSYCLDCGQYLKSANSKYCLKCQRKHPSEKQLQQRAKLHTQTRKNNPAKRPDVGRKISESLKKNHPARSKKHRQKYIDHMNRIRPHKTSKLEDMVATFIPHYERQFKIGFYAVDFANTKNLIVIEVQGCWYHCCQKCFPNSPEFKTQTLTKNNDKKKKTYLTNRGWKVIELWEHDLRINLEETVSSYVHDY